MGLYMCVSIRFKYSLFDTVAYKWLALEHYIILSYEYISPQFIIPFSTKILKMPLESDRPYVISSYWRLGF